MASSSRLPLVPIVGFVALVFGCFYLPWSAWNLWRAAACARWPEVAGTVVSAEVRLKHHSGGIDYEPVVVYQYEVEGQGYESSRFAYSASPFNRTEAEAKRIVARYPPGETVTVYYNPANPEEAVLQRNTAGNNAAAVAMGLLSLIAGAGGIYWWARNQERKARSRAES